MTTSIVLLVLSAGWAIYLAMWFKDARKVSQGRTDTKSQINTIMSIVSKLLNA